MICQQAIILAKVDPHPWRYIALLDQNGLRAMQKNKKIILPYIEFNIKLARRSQCTLHPMRLFWTIEKLELIIIFNEILWR